MNETGMYLKKISVILERNRNRLLKKYDLTAPQIDTLIYLSMQESAGGVEESTLSSIADFFGVKHTSTLHVLKLLEKKGFIHREERAPGYRKKPIFLTEKARIVLEEDKKKLEYVERVMYAGLTKEDCVMLDGYLHRIYGNLVRGIFEDEVEKIEN